MWPMMSRRAVLAALACLIALPAWADRLPGRRSLSETPWGYAVVGSPTRAGAQAQRFEVRPGDCAAQGSWDDCARDRERSEFRPDLEWDPGTQMWIGFSVFLPADFAVSERVNTTIAQIHQRGGPIRVAGGLQSRPPILQMEARGETLSLTVHVPQDDNLHIGLARLAALRGRWTDVVIRFDTRESEPVLQVWLDGTLRADVAGWQTPPPVFYYFKYGLYRSFVSRHGGPMPTQIAFFDEVRMREDPGDGAVTVTPDLALPVD